MINTQKFYSKKVMVAGILILIFLAGVFFVKSIIDIDSFNQCMNNPLSVEISSVIPKCKTIDGRVFEKHFFTLPGYAK